METAFTGTTDVLGFLANQSPQAAHYLDILTSLSNASLKRKTTARKNRYVSRIFSVGAASADLLVSGRPQDLSWADGLNLDDLDATPVIGDEIEDWSFGQAVGEGLSLDWDSLNISQWDSFPFQPGA